MPEEPEPHGSEPESGASRTRKGGAKRLPDAAGAGMLLLAVNLLCAGIGAAIGALIGALVPLLLVGFFVGFGVGIRVVIGRFSNL